jgi:hypothetical protein
MPQPRGNPAEIVGAKVREPMMLGKILTPATHAPNFVDMIDRRP